MALGKGIADMFEAIPERIEVSGQAPTWRVTGGSFDSVLAYAREAYDNPTVIAREDRSRWWRRVTLTVTHDPALSSGAPPLDTFAADPEPPSPEPAPAPDHRSGGRHAADRTSYGSTDAHLPGQGHRRAPAEPA